MKQTNKEEIIMSYRPNKLNEPRERSAHVRELGIVRVRDCGHRREPQHFQIINNGIVRAVCPFCQIVTLQIELDEWVEDRRDED
jgi:hypothetical protein